MKRGYKRLLFFEIIIFIVLFINSFIINILSGYKMTIFLIIIIFCFKYFFGIEKDRHRYMKDIILDIIIFSLLFLLLYYLLGIVIGFAKIGNYFNWYGIKNFILPLILYIILKEFLRYAFICKAEGSILLNVITIILFIYLDITMTIYHQQFTNVYSIFLFISLSLLPSISRNVVFSYITNKVGYKPIIVYQMIIELYQYIIPIIPNPNEYIVAVIEFILPIILGYQIYIFFKNIDDKYIDRNYKKKKIGTLAISSIIIIVLVYFTSGEFHYWSLAIASGSMSPSINKGDVVIVEKINGRYDQLKIGQVIAYKKGEIIIVHRLVNIIKYKNEYFFYTKGDANNNIDNFVIDESMVIGTVNYKLPYIGIPTVWINELWEEK